MVARTLSLAALLIALTVPAYGGLPVAYDARLRPFKKSVHGGDPLGFSLYGTPDCSGTPVYSEILGAGTPQVIVEEVVPVDIKKAEDAPKIARLRATLGVEAVDMALYLRVQGDGVEPVGEPCQVQVSAVVGTPGPQGPPGPPGDSLSLFDATGNRLGPVAPLFDYVFLPASLASPTTRAVWLESIQAIATLPIDGVLPDLGGYNWWSQLGFTEPNCAGLPFVVPALAGYLLSVREPQPVRRRYFVGLTGTPATTVSLASFRDAGETECYNSLGSALTLIPVREVTRESLDLPFLSADQDILAAPLYIAPTQP